MVQLEFYFYFINLLIILTLIFIVINVVKYTANKNIHLKNVFKKKNIIPKKIYVNLGEILKWLLINTK